MMLQAGAQDFVAKDGLTPEAVWRAVQNAVERVSLTRALAESERRFRTLSEELETRVHPTDLFESVHQLLEPVLCERVG